MPDNTLCTPFIPTQRRAARRRGSPWAGLLKLCTLLAFFGLPLEALGQTLSEDAVFRDTQPVTAIDVLVTLEREGVKAWAAGRDVPQQLTAQDFALTVDGEAVDVVVAAPPDEGRWHLQIYIDAPLTAPETVHWASTLLSQHLDALLTLGVVDIVVADPSPRRLLKPTDTRDDVARVLSQLALEPMGSADLHTLRDAFLKQRADGFPELPPDELIPLLVEEERRQVQQRHDTLIAWLADGSAGNPAPDSAELGSMEPAVDTIRPDRRALLYISDGFDTDPRIFYDRFLDEDGEDNTPDPSPAETDVSLPLRQTLASYGWVAVPMLPPQPELLKRGLRLGKFLIRPIGIHMQNAEPSESARADQHGLRSFLQRLNQILLGGFHATYEEHRDVDKAEAYLELARALHGQGKLEDAAAAYDKALFHFSGDPRTADQQAIALAGIGDLMAELGEGLGAQRAYQKALSLDPELAEDVGSGIAFQDPAGALQPWADATVGYVVRGRDTLRSFLDSTDTRMRLTFQLGTVPSGRLLDLDIQTPTRPDRWRYPTWSRSGTPEAVAAARLRLALGTTGDLWLSEDEVVQLPDTVPPPAVALQRDAAGRLHVQLRHPSASPGQTQWADTAPLPIHARVSMAGVSETSDSIHVIHHEVLLENPWMAVDGSALPSDALAWGISVEDLSTGSRRLRVLDRH